MNIDQHILRYVWRGILGLCLLGAPMRLPAQNASTPISVSFKEKDLTSVLEYLNQNSTYRINYTVLQQGVKPKVTVSLEEVDVPTALKQILVGTGYTFTQKDQELTIVKDGSQTTGLLLEGVLIDKGGRAVPFAIVREKASKTMTTSDENGKFSLPVKSNKGEVFVSCVGFDSRSLAYVVGTPLTVKMAESNNTLSEATIVAYGKRTKRDVVGAISSIKSEQIEKVVAPSLESILQGQMAGVGVTNVSGSPGGGGSQVLIRGFSSLNFGGTNDGSPLYVVDGVPVRSNTSENTGGINLLSTLDPTTIERVEVLKDAASAALYGSRAGNGVVLITTKKGKNGRTNFQINVSQSYSWLPKTQLQIKGKAERDLFIWMARQQRSGMYDLNGNVVMPNSYADTYDKDDYNGSFDYFWYNGKRRSDYNLIPRAVTDSLNPFFNNSTNWWEYAFRVGRVTKADLQLSGGTENVRYFVTSGLYDEKGIMISSGFRRLSFLSNLEANLTSKLSAHANVNLAYTSKNGGSGKSKVQGLTYDPKATWTILPGRGSAAERETLKRLLDIEENNETYNVRLNTGLQYDIIKNLVLTSTFAVDHNLTRSHEFTPSYLNFNAKSMTRNRVIGFTMLQNENLLNYKFDLRRGHHFDFLAGMTYNYNVFEYVAGSAEGGLTNRIKYTKDSWPQTYVDEWGNVRALQAFQNNKEEQVMQSFLGRVSYHYKKKYLAEASFRVDGSSVFGRDVRWASFPAVALGWVFTDEGFMKDFWWMNFGKLRASWGQSGQKFDDAYLALGVMGGSDNTFLGNPILVPQILANNKLTWEKSDQYDLGLDLQMLNHRLRVKLDYYYKYSSALLMQTKLPGNVFMVNNVWSNASAISNEGLELEVEGDVYKRKNFTWTLGFNISRNWNMFRKSFDGTDIETKVLGRPVYGIYTYHDEGLVQREEDIPYYYDAQGKRSPLYFGSETSPLRVGGRKIKDQNGDGKIDIDDQYYAGSTIPLAYGGITSQLNWKGWSLGLHFNYMISRKMMNMVKNASLGFSKDIHVLNNDFGPHSFWQKPGDNTPYPSVEFAGGDYIGQFDGDIDSNIENVSFLRLKQLNLTYSLPTAWTKRVGVKEMRVYVAGENLFLLTNYSGIDPEIVDPYTGKDIGDNYPLNRKLTVGLNFKF